MDLTEKIKKELPKYRITFGAISILPFYLKLDIWYLPLDKKVGEIIGKFGNIEGYVDIVYPGLHIEFKNGDWKAEAKYTF
jgi:hypothetical protein